MEHPIYIALGETFITLTKEQALALAELMEGQDNPELDPIRTALLNLAHATPALPAHLARLVKDFDFLACPRCGEGIFTDDEEGIDLLFQRRPSLTCLSCFLVYEADYYGAEYAP